MSEKVDDARKKEYVQPELRKQKRIAEVAEGIEPIVTDGVPLK